LFKTEQFIKNIDKALESIEQRVIVERSTENWKVEYKNGIEQFSNHTLAKQRAAYYRWKSIENADKLLIEFESNFQKQGGRVIWAPEAEDALKEIEYILNKYEQSSIIKSKSSICDEIELNEFLTEKKHIFEESEIGNYIQHISHEKNFHPIHASMHQSKEYIGRLFNNKLSTPLRAQHTVLTDTFAEHIRDFSSNARIAITGANFLIADSGSIAFTEDEGNINFISTNSQVLIVVAGIDKVLSNLNDLDILWPILSGHSKGKNSTSYQTLISGPAGTAEEGPNEIYLVLVDNGRSYMLSIPEQRQALHCINCGACHQVCPVFNMIGGQAYDTVKTGPIGIISNSLLDTKNKDLKSQAFSSPLCGKCNEVCPVNIDLKSLLPSVRNLNNMQDASIQEKYGWISWKKMMLKRKRMNQNNSLKGFMLKTMYKRYWGDQREFPNHSERSFNQLWIDINGTENDEDKII
jgi:L-lactate dehydrogenase complex protein LldF